MKPLSILHLYRIRLRKRLVPEVLAAIGIAVGVALLFASQIANTSLTGSVHALTRGLTGDSQLQLVSRTSSGFDQALLGDVRAIHGVRSASAVLEAQANVVGPRGRRSVELIGADPRTVHLGGSLLRHFSAAALARQRAFALPAPVARAIGARSLEPVRVQLGASTRRALLGIVLQESDIGALVDSPVALAPLDYAQQLAGMRGRVTRILVQAAAGSENSVKDALVRLADNRINVEPASYDATLFDRAATPTNQSTEIFAAISALVGFLFAFNAILMTLPGRRRLVDDLRLDGYRPRTIIEVLLLDALVLGVISCLFGLLLGDALSLYLFHASPGYLTFAFAIGTQRLVTAQSVVIAVLGGMLAACLGVLAPMRDVIARSGRSRSHVGLLRSNRASLAGAVCLLLTVVVLVFVPGAVVLGIGTLTAALLLLLPGLLAVLLSLVARLTWHIPAKAPMVAVAALRSTWPRTVAIAATGAVAVFGSVAIQGAHADLQRGLDRSAKDISLAGDVWAFPPGMNNLLATTSFAAGSLNAIARLPGVRAAYLYRGSFLDYGDSRVWVSAPPVSQGHLMPPHQLVQGDLGLVDRRLAEGGWAVVSKAIAKQHHLQIGSSFTLPAPRPTTFRVAGLSTNIGWPPGAIVMNADDYSKAWDSPAASAYEILTRRANAPLVREEVAHALGPNSGLIVQTGTERDQRQRAASRQGLSRLTQISTLVLIAAVLAMAAAMGNSLWLRRARLADLKLDGFSRMAVWRTLLLESALLVGAGCLIGAVLGLFGQLLGSRAILGVTGFPVVFSFDVLGVIESFLLVTAVAVAIIAVPGYLIADVKPSSSD
jgi:putative ABC transport system permease protein